MGVWCHRTHGFANAVLDAVVRADFGRDAAYAKRSVEPQTTTCYNSFSPNHAQFWGRLKLDGHAHRMLKHSD